MTPKSKATKAKGVKVKSVKKGNKPSSKIEDRQKNQGGRKDSDDEEEEELDEEVELFIEEEEDDDDDDENTEDHESDDDKEEGIDYTEDQKYYNNVAMDIDDPSTEERTQVGSLKIRQETPFGASRG
ncbi:hypothetical protein GGS21DRAFT_489544 [Xylaria nigripes]|nr:hypothetical protein GGS21DRAFT_489544 [Xylaria nigripes]